ILHFDLDAFYASVEQRDDPSLKGKPVVIGADPEGGRGRGVVATASYEARAFGIRSAMPMTQAWRACPDAVYLPPDIERYAAVSREVFATIARHADVLEPGGIDEGYLDVTERTRGDFDEARALAARVAAEVRRDHGLSTSWGVAPSKLVAKIATDMQKPRGLTVVRPGEEERFLAPLPARKIPGVGPKTAERLEDLGVKTCADLAATPVALLARELGVWGPRLAALARGLDDSPVDPAWERKSVGSETTFHDDLPPGPALEEAVARAAGWVAEGLAAEALLARTVVLKVRLEDFTTFTRSRTLALPTDDAATLREAALALLAESPLPKRVRLVGVRGTNLVAPHGARQATLDRWPADVLGERAAAGGRGKRPRLWEWEERER
ncbi:MAG TPA: DNA polymerase IV, partial [Candidatus Thermoplasmatota archaeon]|nr:DNA polymerase IV [Candidatus Thermoplasmatota archaeon]